MNQVVLLIEPLLPEMDGGQAPACGAVLRTTGRRGERTVDVVILDAGTAERAGGDAFARGELERALATRPDVVLLARSRCDSAATDQLLSLLEQLGCSAAVEVADAGRPIDRVAIDDFGDLTAELLINGLNLQGESSPLCDRPDQICWRDLGEPELGRALDAWVARCDRMRVGERAMRVTIRGGGFFSSPARIRALAERAVRRLVVHHVEWTGPEAPDVLVGAIRSLLGVFWRSGTRAPTLAIGNDAHPGVVAVATLVTGPVEPAIFGKLFDVWRAEPGTEFWARLVDDGLRRTLFATLTEARRHGGEAAVLAVAGELLGPPASWVARYRRASRPGSHRVVVIPTWQCELRCQYCRIPKQDGRVMTTQTLERAIDLLLSSDGRELELHFFGGEPFLEYGLLQHALRYGHARATAAGREMWFLFTTNGFALTQEMLDWMADYHVWFQLSLDGDSATQNEFRHAADGVSDSYAASPATKLGWILERKIDHDVVQVVHPKNVAKMAANFAHLHALGFGRVQINYALGARWDREAATEFGRQLGLIGDFVLAARARGERAEIVNIGETLLKVRSNLEVTVDWNGDILGSSAFLPLPAYRDKYLLGHLDDVGGWERYLVEGLSHAEVQAQWFGGGTVENNAAVGAVMTSFVRHMRQFEPE